jgi:hypothetical protein
MIGRATILKWIKEELKETIKSLGLKLGRPEKNHLFSVFVESNGIRSYIPMDFWSGDEMIVASPHVKFPLINKALFDLTGIEDFGINEDNYKCANIGPLGKTNITSRAKLDLYLWPLKKNMRDYFIEVESILNPTALVDKWYKLNEISEINKYFPMGFNYIFIYFIARINNDSRSSQILEEGKVFFKENIALGHNFYEEHLKSFIDLDKQLNELGDNHHNDLLVNTFENTKIIKEVKNIEEDEIPLIHSYYLTDSFKVTDYIAGNIVEFEKCALLALSNSKIAFYDVANNFEELKKKALTDLQSFKNNKLEKSKASFYLGEYKDQKGQLIFKQYAFDMHPRYFNKMPNGDLENDGRLFTKL